MRLDQPHNFPSSLYPRKMSVQLVGKGRNHPRQPGSGGGHTATSKGRGQGPRLLRPKQPKFHVQQPHSTLDRRTPSTTYRNHLPRLCTHTRNQQLKHPSKHGCHPNHTTSWSTYTSCPPLPKHGSCNSDVKNKQQMYIWPVPSHYNTTDELHGSHGCRDRAHPGAPQLLWPMTWGSVQMCLVLCDTWSTFWKEWHAWWNEWAPYTQSVLRTASDHEKWFYVCLHIPLLLFAPSPNMSGTGSAVSWAYSHSGQSRGNLADPTPDLPPSSPRMTRFTA